MRLRFFEILEKQGENLGYVVKVWFSKKCLNKVGRGILSQSRMYVLKTFSGDLAQDPSISMFQVVLPSTSLSLAVGILICYYFGKNPIK